MQTQGFVQGWRGDSKVPESYFPKAERLGEIAQLQKCAGDGVMPLLGVRLQDHAMDDEEPSQEPVGNTWERQKETQGNCGQDVKRAAARWLQCQRQQDRGGGSGAVWEPAVTHGIS